MPANIEGIEKGLIEMLSDSVGLRAVGENLKKFVVRKFLWINLVNDYISLYSNILNGRKEVSASKKHK